jgi:carbon-monoxide dehydrogenase large subunit
MSGPVGRRMLRVEDRPLLLGQAGFVDDVQLPGMLHARFVRSSAAHARVRGVDLEAARRAPGVQGAFAAADVGLPPLVPPIENSSAHSPPRPLLADDVARFVGEPLAVVVADSPYLAEDAAGLAEVSLEELPAVTDPIDAAAAEPLHDHPTNVLFESRIEVGEPDDAFAAAELVIERTFRNPRVCAVPIEPRGTVAEPRDGGVRLLASTQVPHQMASIVAELLALPRVRVTVGTTDVGGGFGQKAHTYPEDVLVAWLALRLGRPVKWVEDRSENLISASHARDQVVSVRAAVDRDGVLMALEADVVCDTGAFGVFPHGHVLEALGTPAMIPGPYRLRNYRARARSVVTNKCPEGAYRGVGLPVSALVHERLMDVLAGELGIDRAEIRRRNFIRSHEMPYTTVTHQRYDSGDYELALDRALEAVGYDGFAREQTRARSEGRLLGLGISSYVEYTAMGSAVFGGRGMVGIAGYDGAWLELGPGGKVLVWTTLPAIGQGVQTTFAQMTAEALGVETASVTVERSDTAVGDIDGTGTFASRSAVSGGGAIVEAAAELRRRLLDDAAERLEAASVDLELADGQVYVAGSPSRSVALADLVSASEPGRYEVGARFDPPATAYPYATHACVVEVEADTGAVRILRYVVSEDCGRIINPLVVEGQTHGAVAQGVGGTLYESVAYDPDGQPLMGSLMDYLVPTAVEIPALELSHLEIPAPDSPNGAKGVGEGGTLAPPAAIANAVSDALGVECNELPLVPERIRLAAAGALEATPADRPRVGANVLRSTNQSGEVPARGGGRLQ